VHHRMEVPGSVRPEMRLLLSVEEAAAAMGLGRSMMYHLVMRQQIASIKVGRMRRIPVAALEEFIRQQLATVGVGE
jgi:excisionase family DNA binding protein